VNIVIQDCNNIAQGNISVTEGALDVKYAINGTGKSTVAKAISAVVLGDQSALTELTPYKYLSQADGHSPAVTGLNNIHSVMTFNEEYVDQYVYQPDEVIKDSFSIFVKTPDYDAHMREIEALLQGINVAFQDHPELDSLIQSFSQFIDGFGKSKSGYSAAGAIGKSIGKGNKISNIPQGLEAYAPYLNQSQDSTNVKWIQWQISGKPYLEIADQCPYCSGSITITKETILKVSDEYDAKSIEHLNKMLQVFKELLPYFDDETARKIQEITDNVTGITKEQKDYLIEIKTQVENLLLKLKGLKQIGFHTLKGASKIADELNKYVIHLSYFSHLRSILTQDKVSIINDSLSIVMEKAGKLQGEIAKQNQLVKKTIEENSVAINEFLQCAGYNYAVSIEETQGQKYCMVLKSLNSDATIVSVKDHLSFGERNAFALILFMFSVLKENPDLVILDDPISSFDGNKKFAIINMLFMSKRCLKNRTVLLLTHEFNTVIDVIHTMPFNFSPAPKAAFLTTKTGVLSEKTISKSDIRSFRQIALDNIAAPIDNLNKLVYLRRLLETEDNTGPAWQLLSNLFHKREVPEIHEEGSTRLMLAEEIAQATNEVKQFIADFAYDIEYAKAQNTIGLIALYHGSTSNYEKLQLYRILFNENSENHVVKKFVNETFHVENDYLFQLNPREYVTVPQYIIDECDKDIASVS